MSSVPPTARALLLSGLAAGSALAVAGCGIVADLLGTGNVFTLSVGDCFNYSDLETGLASGEVSDIPLVECGEAHDSEIYHSHLMEGDTFPGDAAVVTEAEEVCTAEFDGYVGLSFAESAMDMYYLMPDATSWDSFGDREILCIVTAPEQTADSLEGSAR